MIRIWKNEELVRDLPVSAEEWLEPKPKRPVLATWSGRGRKVLKLAGRFPERHRDVPAAAVRYVAGLLEIHPTLFAEYAFDGRTAEADRANIRRSIEWRNAIRY